MGVKHGDKLTQLQKERVAQIIHDYIIENANTIVTGDGGMPMSPTYYMPIIYGVLNNKYKGLCDGYAQAYNCLLRKYGINAISSSGVVYTDDKSTSSPELVPAGHIWSNVNISDDYGIYPTDVNKWIPIDVYWDEPIHEKGLGFDVDPNAKVLNKYFGKPENIFLPKGSEYERVAIAKDDYGNYPFGDGPALGTCNYIENEIYDWS